MSDIAPEAVSRTGGMIDKMPRWARWVLFVPAAMGAQAGALVGLAAVFAVLRVGRSEEPLDPWWEFLLQAMPAYAFVVVGLRVSPRPTRPVTLSLLAVLVALAVCHASLVHFRWEEWTLLRGALHVACALAGGFAAAKISSEGRAAGVGATRTGGSVDG